MWHAWSSRLRSTRAARPVSGSLFGLIMLVSTFVPPQGYDFLACWSLDLSNPYAAKVAPRVGSLRFVGRHGWRSLAIAVGVTALIAAAPGLILGVQMWTDWVDRSSLCSNCRGARTP